MLLFYGAQHNRLTDERVGHKTSQHEENKGQDELWRLQLLAVGLMAAI
jgi:hypothetical protein